jgi:peptide/nickel transport system substrate-binding protein
MSQDEDKSEVTEQSGQSRRQFMATTGAVAGAAALGVSGTAEAARKRHPKRGGTLRFSTRSDSRGLDGHRNYYYYVSHPLAATSMGMFDLDLKMNPKPGIAVEHTVSKDMKTYTFKIRKGATFHDGSAIDANSVKWNFDRIQNPKIGHSFTRSSIKDVNRVEVVDNFTIRCHLDNPSGVLIPSLTYYPVQFMSPNSEANADNHPIGAGPFKFVSWKKYDKTIVERNENWWETDDQGNALPYLDKIIGSPKKEDRVRLTALRTGEVDLIENMAYTDAVGFKKKYGDKFNTWDVPQVGTGYLGFNLKSGPFSYSNGAKGKMMRQAAAHAINHDAIHQAVFSGLSEKARGFYSKASPWFMPELERKYEYDPDKARFLLKKSGGMDEKLVLTSRDAYAYMHQTGEISHAMLTEAGFNISHEIHPYAVLKSKWKKGQYSIDSTANSYRPDPDRWFSANVISTSSNTKLRTGFNSPKADKLIIEAKATLEMSKRKELYQAVEEIINEELPMIYTHFIPLTSAASQNLMGYEPAFNGPYSTQRAGIRTAYLS